MVSTVRRVFFYILSLITLGILVSGLRNLLSLLFDTILARFTLAQIGDLRAELSLGIAMVVIGAPLWFLFWGIVQRQTAKDGDERASALRSFYLNFILITSAIITALMLLAFIEWLLGGLRPEGFSPGNTATLAVAAAVWAYHRHVCDQEGYPGGVAQTVRRWYVYILSAIGLVWLTVGMVQLTHGAIVSMPIWKADIVRGSFWNSGTQGSTAAIITGALMWAFFWFYTARHDSNSSLRWVYYYLFTVLGGAIAGLTSLVITFYRLLHWAFGAERDSAGYFQFLGWSVPLVLVTLFIWSYHLNLAETESARQEQQVSARRVHYYIMSFLGLGTLIAGLIIILGIPLDWLINSMKPDTIVVAQDWWNNQLSQGLAMLAVSVPIWLYYWGGIVDAAENRGVEERGARSRRVYLYVLIGASIVILAADLVNIIYQLLNGLLSGSTGVAILSSMKWSLQTVFIAIPVLVYHFGVARQDQKAGSEASSAHKNVMVIIADRKSPVIARLEQRLGYKVRVAQYQGEVQAGTVDLADSDIGQLVLKIQSSPGSDVIAVITEGPLAVIPYKK